MKEIKAIIQPFMQEKVLRALRQLDGLSGFTVSQVMGCGISLAMSAGSPKLARNQSARWWTTLGVGTPWRRLLYHVTDSDPVPSRGCR